MKHIIFILLFLLNAMLPVFGQHPSKNFHIYLCIGQSNMAGQAPITEEYKYGAGDRFLKMGTVPSDGVGVWSKAIPPLSHAGAKLGPTDFFGRKMLSLLPPTDTVAVIVVAVEGCAMRLFNEDTLQDYLLEVSKRKYWEWFFDITVQYGNNPYRRLIDCAKEAQKRGVIEGILLHQGETDAHTELWDEQVKDLYNHITSELHLNPEETPIIAGEIAHNGQESIRNAMIHRLPLWIPNAAVVSSKGCPLQEDRGHFTLEGYKKLGERYALQMMKMKSKKHKKH